MEVLNGLDPLSAAGKAFIVFGYFSECSSYLRVLGIIRQGVKLLGSIPPMLGRVHGLHSHYATYSSGSGSFSISRLS
ncbi:hypothetical protein [Bradyrhizobium manausense]|uniref:hypothetical protein n=1 Tax=Bradyrhizobium manausense TaxID=989370 RepID=UPI0012EE7183|nr:hypothetical protein [Bradyrhizobium manausense]